MNKLLYGFLIGILLSIAFVLGASGVAKANSAKLGNPWDGSEKAWEQGTVVTDLGYTYVLRDENIPPHFYFNRLTRVYVQYEVDGYYFVEKYYDCFEQPIYGWIWHENILLDRNVIPLDE